MLTMPLCLAQALSLIVLIWTCYYSISESHGGEFGLPALGETGGLLILREFREDLLREEHPVTSLREDYERIGWRVWEIPAYLGTYSSTVL